MNKLKNIIRDNKILVGLFIIIILVFIGAIIYNLIKKDEIYSPSMDHVPYIKFKYAENEYQNVDITDADMVTFYYRDFIAKLINDPDEAWKLIGANSKKNKFNNDIKIFKNYIKSIKTIQTEKAEISKYKYDKKGYKNVITIISSENYLYEFTEYGVWKYSVEIGSQID